MKTPSVSVILSVFNGASYLREAIESVLNQTFKDFEFIIVNDGSTDDTVKIIDSFTDNRVVYLCNKENLGLVKSLNKGLAIAQGEFIARMDADDISEPNRFQKQLLYLRQHPEIGVLGTAMTQIDNLGRPISVSTPPISHEEIFWHSFFGCSIFHATVMMRRKGLLEVGGYNINFLHSEDIELWSRLFAKTKFANLSESLYIRRLHRNSIISTQADSQYLNGVIVRQKLLSSFLGNKIPTSTVSWFLWADHPLNKLQRIIIINLLLELYSKITKTNSTPINIKESLRVDLINKIMLACKSWPYFLFRRVSMYSSKLLSVPTRHRLKVKLNKYWKKPLT